LGIESKTSYAFFLVLCELYEKKNCLGETVKHLAQAALLNFAIAGEYLWLGIEFDVCLSIKIKSKDPKVSLGETDVIKFKFLRT
jgi:hypothetical protein